MFGALLAAEGTAHETDRRAALEGVAREFSPRLEVHGPREVTLDLNGLTRLFGDARTIAGELRRTAADRGLQVRVAIAATRSAARLLVHFRAGQTVIEPGDEADTLAPLPIALLDRIAIPHSQLPTPQPASSPIETLRRWGIRTLGEFAALPADDVAARLGRAGVEWQRLARGEDRGPLVPAIPEERFEQTLELEWPIEGLEPLSFVLGRLMEPLAVHLERRDRGAAMLHVRLRLVTRVVHERSLQLPAPMRDARALRTLALLDLESHPPDAAIDRVTVAVDPTPGRVVQFSLLTRPLPSADHLSTLLARLAAVMGEGRCGSPALVNSWRPGAFAMTPFAPRDSTLVRRHTPPRHEDVSPVVALRRFRVPIPVRVRVENGRPVRLEPSRGVSGGRIAVAAGPWRTSGAWWEEPVAPKSRSSEQGPVAPKPQSGEQGLVAPKPRSGEGGWDRDEWDVALADGVTYRLFRERVGEKWCVEGVVD